MYLEIHGCKRDEALAVTSKDGVDTLHDVKDDTSYVSER